MKTRIGMTASLALATALLLAACNKQPAPAPAPAPTPTPAPAVPAPAPAPAPAPVPAGVAVASIDLGTAAAPPVAGGTAPAAFATSDKIVALVSTTGSATAATLAAKWTYQDGQVVDESTQSIAPTRPATTTFTIEKPDGWPVGRYTVTVTLDGQPAGTREYEIR